jgi:UDP-N-acetylmuramate dehydrogenase
LTTFRIGGRPRAIIDCATESELVDAVRQTDQKGSRLLLLGGGSNLLVAENVADLTVVRDRRGVARAQPEAGRIVVTASAGASWDALVAWTIRQGWSTLAPLSGIPGSVGALPVQNVGAYGAAASDVVRRVRVFDRIRDVVEEWDADRIQFSYRDSALKRSAPECGGATPRWIVLEVVLDLGPAQADVLGPAQADVPDIPDSTSAAGVAVAYPELAQALRIPLGARAPADAVRLAVLRIRRSKGMVLDSSDRDTWSAGSYFTNPILSRAQAEALPAGAPRFAGQGRVKTSAAWLMARAGVEPGRGLTPEARVTASSKHVLALTNRGGATADDVLALEAWIVARVRDRFGVLLTREPVLVSAAP